MHELLWGYDDPLLLSLEKLLPAGLIPRTHVALVVNMSSADVARTQGVSVVNTGRLDRQQTWNVSTRRGSGRCDLRVTRVEC